MPSDTSTSSSEDMYAPGSARLRNVRRFNTVARLILKSPLHRVLSSRLMLLSFVGRNSGRTYTTPIAYIEDDGRLLIAAGGRWRENLRSRPARNGNPRLRAGSGKEPTEVRHHRCEPMQPDALVVRGPRSTLSQGLIGEEAAANNTNQHIRCDGTRNAGVPSAWAPVDRPGSR
jgi:hypothetical protein